MSRTYKDQKANKKFDKRLTEHKPGVKKSFKRASNKRARKTPITSRCLDMQYTQQKVTIKVPQNIVKGSLPLLKKIEVTLTFQTPSWIDIENTPQGLDIWSLD